MPKAFLRRCAVAACWLAIWAAFLPSAASHAGPSTALAGPLYTTGTDSAIYDQNHQPVRLVGFNWGGTDRGGRADYEKAPDVCGLMWRTPADPIVNGVTFDDFYRNLREWGYNSIRLPISWHNLEPVAPVWSDSLNRYVHTYSPAYVRDLKSIVSNARRAGLVVILDMQQDSWSPALHNITNGDGTKGYCEGAGMPRWLYPSIDAKPATTQNVDYRNGMNWFFRDIHDPWMRLTRQSPWQMFYSAWDFLSYTFSARSGYPDHAAVVGADIFNEPYFDYIGARPPAGQSVLQAAGWRLWDFYSAIAPAIVNWNPTWLLIFEDGTGNYNTADPKYRQVPMLTSKPRGNYRWVYSGHIYNLRSATFQVGDHREDDRAVNVAEALLANAKAWKVPLYFGEFSSFTHKTDARKLTESDMGETKKLVAWAKRHGVHWSFWCYTQWVAPHMAVDYSTGRPIPAVVKALATGL